MIRRGLQVVFLCGITFLGAAPLFGQAGTTNYPTRVTLQGFPVAEHNGLFMLVGGTFNQDGYVFQRYETGLPAKFWVVFGDQASGDQKYAHFYTNYPTSVTTAGRVYWRDFFGPAMPSALTGAYQQSNGQLISGATWIFSWAVGPVSDEEKAFPDWAKATVLIPLGFSFAMAFWASAVALSVAMKWVRDLASAAT